MFFNTFRFRCYDANDGGGGGNDNGSESKTFSQEDVNRIAAREKQQGIAAALKALGFESTEDAKKAIENWRKSEDDKKTETQKANEAKEAAEKAKVDSDNRATFAEHKFAVVKAGAKPENAEDIVLLATAKMNDSTDFDAAVEVVKKAYPTLFESESDSKKKGTGGASNPARKDGANDDNSIGKRLAEQRKPSNNKNPYFKN